MSIVHPEIYIKGIKLRTFGHGSYLLGITARTLAKDIASNTNQGIENILDTPYTFKITIED